MKLPVCNSNGIFEPLFSHVEQTRCAIHASAAAVAIIQNGHISEWYSGFHHAKPGARPVTSASQFHVYSIRKTHIGLALALAMTDAGLDPQMPVYPFIDDIPKDLLEVVTLGDVLTKTTSKFFGEAKVESEGLAARVVKKVTDVTIAQLLTERILKPLQLKNTEWAAVPKESLVCDFTAADGYASVRLESDEGHERNLYMTARDLAYWGYLFLNNGVVDGQRLIPEAVFELSEKIRSMPKYAGKRVMGWYYGENMFEAFGATGCHITVLPRNHTVAVRMYNRYATEHTETLMKCLHHDSGIHIN